MDAVEGKAETREMRDVGLVRLLGKGIALEISPGGSMMLRNSFFRWASFFIGERALQADDKIGADEAIGVEIADRSAESRPAPR